MDVSPQGNHALSPHLSGLSHATCRVSLDRHSRPAANTLPAACSSIDGQRCLAGLPDHRRTQRSVDITFSNERSMPHRAALSGERIDQITDQDRIRCRLRRHRKAVTQGY